MDLGHFIGIFFYFWQKNQPGLNLVRKQIIFGESNAYWYLLKKDHWCVLKGTETYSYLLIRTEREYWYALKDIDMYW